MKEERVSLKDMLDARERRALEQERLACKCGLPVISFTMNIPGEIKVGPDIEWGYERGKREIMDLLGRLRSTTV